MSLWSCRKHPCVLEIERHPCITKPPGCHAGLAAWDSCSSSTHHITHTSCTAGTMLGVLFIIIGLKLSLGTAGIIPSLNIPGGLISFAAVKSMAAVGSSLQLHTRAPMAHRLLFQPFGLQENAVMQTFVLSMGTGGFGSYITGRFAGCWWWCILACQGAAACHTELQRIEQLEVVPI